jgi:UDP-GlcNAc:undecaprenyl-phosphate GlcNAc-1-phosphate transferase
VIDYLVVAGIAAIGTFLMIFPVRAVAVRFGVVVHPDARHIHTKVTPTAGGGAMFLGFVITMAVASRLGYFHGDGQEQLGVVLGGAAILVVGLIDDLHEMSAPAKVAGQVIAAMVLYFFGVTIFALKLPFMHYTVLAPQWIPLVTALWVVGMTNAVNLIDGLDGLAAGIVAVASGALCVYGIRLVDLGALGSNAGPLIAAGTCGICLGFLPHNFHPARIFMGDAGSMVLGLLLAASTMLISGRIPDTAGLTYFFFAPFLIPIVILAVPILDTIFAIARRTAHRTGVDRPDLEHLHHRLLRLGHGHRRAVLILCGWTAVLSAFALYPTFTPERNVTIYIGIALLVGLLLTVFRPGRRVRDGAAAGSAGGPPAELAPEPEAVVALPGSSASPAVSPPSPVPDSVAVAESPLALGSFAATESPLILTPTPAAEAGAALAGGDRDLDEERLGARLAPPEDLVRG